MDDFVEVMKTSELADGAMKNATVQGQDVLLARAEGQFYAAAGRCPHYGGMLSRGKLEGTIVTCPLHGSQFDLKTGRVIRWVAGKGLMSVAGRALSAMGQAAKTARPLTVYEVKIDGDRVVARIT